MINSFVEKLCFKIVNRLRAIIIGLNKGVKLNGTPSIRSNVRIIVEKGAFLKIGKNVRIEHDTVIFCKKGSRLSIGDNTSTGHHTEISCYNSIEIGDDVIMAPYTYITDSNHSWGLKGLSIKDQPMVAGITKIGSNVWLCRGSMVLKDARIGNNSIVGANSVVTKIFLQNCILGGVPAKVIKEL